MLKNSKNDLKNNKKSEIIPKTGCLSQRVKSVDLSVYNDSTNTIIAMNEIVGIGFVIYF